MFNNKIRHIVMLDFSALSQEKLAHLITEFEKLAEFPEILAFEWGVENNDEGPALEFTHCFMLTFASFEDRTRYLNNPLHRKFEKAVMPFVKKVLVFDYAAKEVK